MRLCMRTVEADGDKNWSDGTMVRFRSLNSCSSFPPLSTVCPPSAAHMMPEMPHSASIPAVFVPSMPVQITLSADCLTFFCLAVLLSRISFTLILILPHERHVQLQANGSKRRGIQFYGADSIFPIPSLPLSSSFFFS